MLKPSRFLLGPLFALLLTHGISSASAQESTPGWNSGWRNADGSLKLALAFGGGYDTSAGATRKYQGVGWNYRMGAGYRLNRRFAALVEYGFDHFGIPQSQAPYIYRNFLNPPTSVDGNIHLWSVTLEPTFNYFQTEHYGGYLVGGGGFYRKLTSINLPANQCVLFGGFPACFPVTAAMTHTSNNAGGANLGAGFGWRVWDHSNTKLFLEARYVWIDGQSSPNNTLYPPANYHTGYYPITGGVRW